MASWNAPLLFLGQVLLLWLFLVCYSVWLIWDFSHLSKDSKYKKIKLYQLIKRKQVYNISYVLIIILILHKFKNLNKMSTIRFIRVFGSVVKSVKKLMGKRTGLMSSVPKGFMWQTKNTDKQRKKTLCIWFSLRMWEISLWAIAIFYKI